MGLLHWCIIIWLVVSLAWKASSVARYYLKLIIYAASSVVLATAPIPIMLLRPRSSKNALIPAAGLRYVGRYILGLKMSVKGKENIINDSGCVVLINHQSVVDLLVLAELWPVLERCTVISKKEIFYIWPFGLAAWLWGTIFIDRLNGVRAQDSINNTGQVIKSSKARVLMFPEGTRSQESKLLPFKKGAFHLAIASGCPIQPVVVTKYSFLGPRSFESGDIEISILPKIPTADYTKETITDLMDKTYDVMQNHFFEISGGHGKTPNNNIDKSKND